MNPFIFALVSGVITLLMLFYFVPIGHYFTALFSGARIEIQDLMMMRLRKVPVKMLVDNFILAQNAEVPVSISQLEVHYLAGGNVNHVVKAMILAKSSGIDLNFKAVSKADLAGIDIVNEVKKEIAAKEFKLTN